MSNSSMHGGIPTPNKSMSNPVGLQSRSLTNASGNTAPIANDGITNVISPSNEEIDPLNNMKKIPRMQKTGSMRVLSQNSPGLAGMGQRPTHGSSGRSRAMPPGMQNQLENQTMPLGNPQRNQPNQRVPLLNNGALRPPAPFVRNKSFVASDKEKLNDGDRTGSIQKLRSLRSSQESNDMPKDDPDYKNVDVKVKSPIEETKGMQQQPKKVHSLGRPNDPNMIDQNRNMGPGPNSRQQMNPNRHQMMRNQNLNGSQMMNRGPNPNGPQMMNRGPNPNGPQMMNRGPNPNGIQMMNRPPNQNNHQMMNANPHQQNMPMHSQSQHINPNNQNQQKMGQKPSTFKQTRSFNPKSRNNIERAPTIPEDENESLVSSFKANTQNNNLSTISGELPKNSLIKKDSIGSDKNKNEANLIEPEKVLSKQATPIPTSKRLEDDFTAEAEEVSIPDFLENKAALEQIKDEVRPLELSGDGEVTPKIIDTAPQTVVNKTEPELVYFESKDPKPKVVTPLGGSGPTLTKTLVKKPVQEPVHQTKPNNVAVAPNISNTNEDKEAEALAKEEAELKKLEDEIAQLTKEAESNLQSHPGDGLGEIIEINEQTIMVDGKRKRKKKKKKKRKMIGGGEETIANITIDEVFVDEEPPPEAIQPPTQEQPLNDLKLNPAKKKKVKKHKNKITSLNTVEEDSKEQSQLTDAIKSDPLEDKDIEELEDEEDIEVNPANVQNTQNEPTQLNQPEITTKIEPKVKSIKPEETNFKKADSIEKVETRWKFPEDEGMPVDFGDEDEKLEDPKTQLPQVKDNPEPVGKVLNENQAQSKKMVEVSPIKTTSNKGLMYLNNDESKQLENEMDSIKDQHQFSGMVTPDKLTETHDKSTEDQTILNKNLQMNKFNRFNSNVDRVDSKSEVKKLPTFPKQDMEAGIQGFNGAISLLPLNCDEHRDEYIKFFCRDEDCKYGLCPM